MHVLIGLACVLATLWLWFRLGRRSALERLSAAGGVRRKLSEAIQKADYIALATIENHQYENRLRAVLSPEGISVYFKGEEDEVFLPLEMVTVTGKTWTYPLTFGIDNKIVGLNLGSTVTADAVERMMKQNASNKRLQAIGTKVRLQLEP